MRGPSGGVLRVAAAAALILLLSGCLAAAPVQDVQPAPVDEDGMLVTATRVEPVVHAVDEVGRIAARPCIDREQACNMGLGAYGLAWDTPTRDFADPAALFWRVNLRADWESESLVSSLKMTVYITKPCGIACVKAREVASVEDPIAPTIEDLDLFLAPGETGVRVRLETVGYTETSLGEAAVDYHLHGGVAGFRPVAAPVVLN